MGEYPDTLKEHEVVCSKCRYGEKKTLKNYAYNPTYTCKRNVFLSYTCKRNNYTNFGSKIEETDFLNEDEFKI